MTGVFKMEHIVFLYVYCISVKLNTLLRVCSINIIYNLIGCLFIYYLLSL